MKLIKTFHWEATGPMWASAPNELGPWHLHDSFCISSGVYTGTNSWLLTCAHKSPRKLEVPAKSSETVPINLWLEQLSQSPMLKYV